MWYVTTTTTTTTNNNNNNNNDRTNTNTNTNVNTLFVRNVVVCMCFPQLVYVLIRLWLFMLVRCRVMLAYAVKTWQSANQESPSPNFREIPYGPNGPRNSTP